MKLVTISREFGSGGRELGRLLAAELGFTYYDREIEAEIAARTGLHEEYVARAIEEGTLRNIPLHFGITLSSPAALRQRVNVLVEKERTLRRIAKSGDCVIVGRAADIILADLDPFKIFVHAKLDSRVARCMAREAQGDERLLRREIRRIDGARRAYERMFGGAKWGDRTQYHLCIDTSKADISVIARHLAAYLNEILP